ncbi:hypothetical protein NDU88_008431 [Pleurodeles waltl]|uniref:Uncharacterized protein n=1 Tax=Pleurodeles waltl TaxID=8319 RepID=A0AAV7QQP3_PLEWA|nr:hypothetical protein NDU88_008431 [Pleurodeles waltl]
MWNKVLCSPPQSPRRHFQHQTRASKCEYKSPVRPQGPSPGPPAAQEDHQSAKSSGPPPPEYLQSRGLTPAAFNPSPAAAADPACAKAEQAFPLQAAWGRGLIRPPIGPPNSTPSAAGSRQPPPRRASSSAWSPAKADHTHNTAGLPPAEPPSTPPAVRPRAAKISGRQMRRPRQQVTRPGEGLFPPLRQDN